MDSFDEVIQLSQWLDGKFGIKDSRGVRLCCIRSRASN